MNFKFFGFKTFIFMCALMILTSCASNKKIVYLNEQSSLSDSVLKYENVLQPDDILVITVTSEEPELASPFNLMYLNTRSTEARNGNNDALFTYLIDQEGNIDFAGVGEIKLAGLTRIEAENKIKDILSKQIVNPGVILRLLNFKISVLGEVQAPGVKSVAGERVTLLEALSMAGDLTIYGKRKNITIIRENSGVKTIAEVDITNTDFINSPYYYLNHNDVVYVKPNKTKVNSSVIGPNLTVGLSAISLIVTIIALSTK